MDANKIIEELTRRFAAPLPEFYRRRIVFWFDEDGEFDEFFDRIELEGVKLVRQTKTNNFAVKKLLAKDEPDANFLVYRPFSVPDEENWLLDMELYGETFRADRVSIQMETSGLSANEALRDCVKKYRKFFNSSRLCKALKARNVVPSSADRLETAIMATLAKTEKSTPDAVVKATLKAGRVADENAIYQKFVEYGIVDSFWRMVRLRSGYPKEEGQTPDLAEFATHLTLTAASQTAPGELFAGLQNRVSFPHRSYCYGFVSDWIHSDDASDLKEIAREVERDLKPDLSKLFGHFLVSEIENTEVFPCVNEVILGKLASGIDEDDADEIVRTVEKRRARAWYDEFKDYYECVLSLAKMKAFYRAHEAGFHTLEPTKVWEEYTSEYYVMDTYYREFHERYFNIENSAYHETLTDLFKDVRDKVEGLYSNWFLGALGENWTNASEENLSEHGRILEVPLQTDFYRDYVASASAKIYVVVSDALRYEVAAALAKRLETDPKMKANVALKSVQGIFPTITPFGMAALLPHQKLTVETKNGKLAVLVDGISADVENREKILKAAEPASVALKYAELVDMKGAERQARVKGMKVVYIYHDAIDHAGHNDDASVFQACKAAIEQIENTARIIANEWGGANIVITADHGFLYTNKPLAESDKAEKTTEKNLEVEVGRRYAIMKKGAAPALLAPVKFVDPDAPFDAFTPRSVLRIALSGGGSKQYVHGGASLQEMVVPVIEYHFLRNQSKTYLNNKSKYDSRPVEIKLLSAIRKIGNKSFALNFYQSEPVGGALQPATYRLYFVDAANQPVSDEPKIIADKTGDESRDREFRVRFHLKERKFDAADDYYLVVVDEDGRETLRETFQIDVPLAFDDFGF